jgi:hypothetical protein
MAKGENDRCDGGAEPRDQQVQGIRFLGRLQPLLARLHGAQCERDKAGNRTLHYDELCSLILLTFFNPTFKTLADLNTASRLRAVRRKLGCSYASVGSISESLRLFDPELLEEICQELLGQVRLSPHADERLRQLVHVPTAVDGSFLSHLPRIAQAALGGKKGSGWKLHAHFEVLRGIPTFARVTDASGRGPAGEKAVLRDALQPDRCYIVDRGYEEFALFNAIVAARSSYVCRVRNDHAMTPEEVRPIPPEAAASGVLEDALGRMGSPKSKRIEHPDHLQRRVVLRAETHPKRGGRRRQAAQHDIVLVTNLLDVPAEVISLLYRCRWLIELFFRWLKCVLACRHLLSKDAGGVQIQMYCALIACLLIQLSCPIKPNRRTFVAISLYQQGWATEEELLDIIQREVARAKKTS